MSDKEKAPLIMMPPIVPSISALPVMPPMMPEIKDSEAISPEATGSLAVFFTRLCQRISARFAR